MSRLKRLLPILALVALLAGVFVATAAAIRFSDESCRDREPNGCRPPEGVVGASYSHKLEIVPGGGTAPYTYTLINGAFPPGLSLNSSTGAITGTPTVAGKYTPWVEGADDCTGAPHCPYPDPTAPGGVSYSPQAKTEDSFTINVNPGVRITTNSLSQPASVGVVYSAPIEAMLVTSLSPLTGTPAGALMWSIVAGSGTLPPGLTLGNGVISGTPTTEGSYQFAVQAELDPTRRHSQTFTIVVRSPVSITSTGSFEGEARIARTEVGVPISATLRASGGAGTYTWSLASGSLPPGVTTSNGTIVGKPTTPGAYPFSLSAADAEGRTANFGVTVLVAPKLAISTLLLRPAKVGKPYRAKLATTGGVLPRNWKVKRGPLPRGIRFDRTLGLLSGTPTRPGRYRVTFEATDGLEVKAVKTLVIEVLA